MAPLARQAGRQAGGQAGKNSIKFLKKNLQQLFESVSGRSES